MSKHLRGSANDESDDNDVEGFEGPVIDNVEEEENIDPRWNELKKILDNN